MKKIKDGVIYTDYSVAKFMVELANPDINDFIIEPAVGKGVFLIALLDFMLDKRKVLPSQLYQWFIKHVTAIEINSESVSFSKREVQSYFLNKAGIKVEVTNIYCADGLSHRSYYDLCIGNPPYITARHLDKYLLVNLRSNYSTCRTGNVDIYYAFIEHYLNLCKRVCFITPNSWLKNKSSANLREILIPKLNTLIDFKNTIIFQNAAVHTNIILTEPGNESNIKYANSIVENNQQYFTVNKNSLLGEFKSNNKNVIYSELATLRNGLYMCDKRDGRFYTSDNTEVESDILVPCLKLTDHDPLANVKYIICPYNINENSSSLISEYVMQEKFPKTYAYLLRVKDVLALRDSGKGSYESWYAYGRKQGLNRLDKSMLCIPRMIGNKLQPKLLNLEGLLNQYTDVLFTSGMMVPADDTSISLLSEDFRSFVKEHGRLYSGKPECYHAINTRIINNFLNNIKE